MLENFINKIIVTSGHEIYKPTFEIFESSKSKTLSGQVPGIEILCTTIVWEKHT
jgi:hypothetical protein